MSLLACRGAGRVAPGGAAMPGSGGFGDGEVFLGGGGPKMTPSRS
jgi:hypothetical protein